MRRHLFPYLTALVLIGSAVVLAQGSPRANAAPQASANRAVTFAEHVGPIVYANCVSCHRPGEAAPFSLLSYEEVAKRGALIARVTASRYMPPWHAETGFGEFIGERRLTDAQISTIAEWVKQGLPRGDERRMPKLPEFPADGWRLGQPDLVLEMPAGFDIPASGPDVFRNFVIPTALPEDRWVSGIEYRPGARKVVHHALFAHVAGGSLAARDGADGRPGFGGMGTVGVGAGGAAEAGGLGGWAVGATPRMFPEGFATRVPKGSDFLLQLHFHPTGKPETEKSLIGIYFADKAPDKALSGVQLPALFGFGAGIDIPAGTKEWVIKDSFTLPGDVRVYMANAHAHYLAREMKAVATLPDGSTKPLLWIKDWDFNWQDSYVYKEPFTLPRGTRIDATITYDNSAANPRNPISPPRRALWGEQSYDEMGMVGFAFELVDRADLPAFQQVLGMRTKLAIQAAGKNGTLGRFLARAKRESGGRQQLSVFDRAGAIVARVGEPSFYVMSAISPDGSQIAAVKVDDSEYQDIWVYDVKTGRGRTLTSDEPRELTPVWSADGRSIAFTSARGNTFGIYRRAADGSGAEERLYEHTDGATIFVTDWSADGKLLTFWANDTMWVMPVGGTPVAVPIPSARNGRFSPDGKLLAFGAVINQPAGRFDAYVMAIDGSSQDALTASVKNTPVKVSTANAIGGIAWRADGRELLYLSQPPGQAWMAAEVIAGPTVTVGTPRKLFDVPPGLGGPAQLSDVATADAQRFVVTVNLPPRQPAAPPAAR